MFGIPSSDPKHLLQVHLEVSLDPPYKKNESAPGEKRREGGRDGQVGSQFGYFGAHLP